MGPRQDSNKQTVRDASLTCRKQLIYLFPLSHWQWCRTRGNKMGGVKGERDRERWESFKNWLKMVCWRVSAFQSHHAVSSSLTFPRPFLLSLAECIQKTDCSAINKHTNNSKNRRKSIFRKWQISVVNVKYMNHLVHLQIFQGLKSNPDVAGFGYHTYLMSKPNQNWPFFHFLIGANYSKQNIHSPTLQTACSV